MTDAHAMMASEALPRVAVVGDISPERTTGGDLLLYRLLVGYPADRITVIDGPLSASNPDRRLPGVKYQRFAHLPLPPRLYRTRFSKSLNALTALTTGRPSRSLWELLRAFAPDVLLTIPQGFQWLTAAATARQHGLPVVLLCHDDWVDVLGCPTRMGDSLHRTFGQQYRAASARLAVCQSMADLYRSEYGVDARVLWPARGKDSPEATVRVRPLQERTVVVYAGSIFRESYTHLAQLADALGTGGEVHIYSRQGLGPLTGRENVRHHGFLSPTQMADRIAATADALFVSMDFRPEARRGTQLSFPSKIADYTAIGLPLVVYGPEYCSAVAWARQFANAAVVVTEPTVAALANGLGQLRSDPSRRTALAAAAVDAGAMFDERHASEVFRETLSACRGTPDRAVP